MNTTLTNPIVSKKLNALLEDARTNDSRIRATMQPMNPNATSEERFRALAGVYMPVGRDFGNLLYTMVRTARAKTIVEFGTSFGVSTLFLAAAVSDYEAGKVVTAEFIPEKSAKAKQNLTEAGLAKWVDFRVGDALQTLKDIKDVDFVFLDGEKSLYYDVLKLLEPNMKPGCIVAADNTDHKGLENFLAHVRDAKNGYVTSGIFTGTGDRQGAHEIAIRL